MITWMIACNIVVIIVLALRFYAARLLHRAFRMDDGFLIVASVGVFGQICFAEHPVAHLPQVSYMALQGTMVWGEWISIATAWSSLSFLSSCEWTRCPSGRADFRSSNRSTEGMPSKQYLYKDMNH